jgi:uncharacterized protein (TIGR02679 family)
VGVDRERLDRLLGAPELGWLLQRARERLETGAGLDGSATLRNPDEAQRSAVGRLLGRPAGRGTTISVRLGDVDEVVRRSGAAPGLAAAVEALGGPLRDRRAEREAAASSWRTAEGPLDELAAARPVLAEWRERLRATGLLRRLTSTPDEAAALVAQLVPVVQALPAADEPLAVFAARVAGNAHALDDGRPLSTLASGAAAAIGGGAFGTGAAERRRLWAEVGVLVADLVAPALTLGLPGDAASPLGRVLAEWRVAGEPVHLSLRQLARYSVGVAEGTVVSVCENPTVVSAAAERLGARCAPLVCAGGQPSGAVRALLASLVASGARLRYHGDFDWGGLRIAAGVFDRFGATPWRYDAASYAAAAAGSSSPLRGLPAPAPWAPGLVELMSEAGVRVEEEQVLDDLLDDLA